MVAELADLRRSPPWEAAAVTVPVLALRGEHAKPHHCEGMRRLAEMLPDCRSELVVGAGHAGPHTNADAVATAVVDFLRPLSPPSAPPSTRSAD